MTNLSPCCTAARVKNTTETQKHRKIFVVVLFIGCSKSQITSTKQQISNKSKASKHKQEKHHRVETSCRDRACPVPTYADLIEDGKLKIED
jgi:hypothetical protein